MTTPQTSPPHPPPAQGATGSKNAAGGNDARPAARRNTVAGTGPGTRTALALLIAVLVTGPACLIAIYASPPSVRGGVAWGSIVAAVLLCAAVTVAARAVCTAQQLREDLARKDTEAGAERALTAHFADVTVPVLVDKLRSGASAQTALAAIPTVVSNAHQRVLHLLATEVHRSEGLRAQAMSSCASAAGRVQALATSMAADLREMEHKHADEEVLGDLLHLDHRTAQVGRLADSIAVLTGARSGRRWTKPIVMESVLRGALGRISGYQRIRLHSTSTLGVAGHAAEGVMHALAELMDNAANFSPPTSEVHVYVEEVQAGVVVTIEDGGLVMGEVALRRAQQAVSADSDQDLTTLSGTRLGLAVVGRLARKHGLSVSFRPSAHGGTGVLMMIPRSLVSQAKREDTGGTRSTAPASVSASGSSSPASASEAPTAPAAEAPSASAAAATSGSPTASAAEAPTGTTPRTTRTPPAAEPDVTHETGDFGSTADELPASREGLPKRRRTSAAPAGADPQPPPEPSPERSPEPSPDPSPEHVDSVEYGDSGLPKRRRGQTLAAATERGVTPDQLSADRTADTTRSTGQSGSRFGAFRRAVQGGQPSEEQGTGDGATPATPAPSAPRPEDDTE